MLRPVGVRYSEVSLYFMKNSIGEGAVNSNNNYANTKYFCCQGPAYKSINCNFCSVFISVFNNNLWYLLRLLGLYCLFFHRPWNFHISLTHHVTKQSKVGFFYYGKNLGESNMKFNEKSKKIGLQFWKSNIFWFTLILWTLV